MKNLLLPLLCLALILPLCPTWAQEAEEAGESATPVQQTQEAQDYTALAQKAGNTAFVWVKKIIGYLSQIGAVFGKTTGFRIGGTTGTAIGALVLAKLIKDRTPLWVTWLLYLTGGTMFAGGGANTVQLVMRYLPE